MLLYHINCDFGRGTWIVPDFGEIGIALRRGEPHCINPGATVAGASRISTSRLRGV